MKVVELGDTLINLPDPSMLGQIVALLTHATFSPSTHWGSKPSGFSLKDIDPMEFAYNALDRQERNRYANWEAYRDGKLKSALLIEWERNTEVGRDSGGVRIYLQTSFNHDYGAFRHRRVLDLVRSAKGRMDVELFMADNVGREEFTNDQLVALDALLEGRPGDALAVLSAAPILEP